MLRAEKLVKIYKGKTVVSDFSIKVQQGEVVALLGPNGAGKTTSFYMITGMIKPNSGKIYLNNVDITNFPIYMKARIGIGYLSQESSIFKNLTVHDNIKCALECAEVKEEQHNFEIDKLLSYMHIEYLKFRKCELLSGGEKRRVEIARILAIKPSFVLLDEPFAGVDPVAIHDIVELIQKLKKMNIGIIITDHNVKEAMRVADRSYVLIQGKVVAEGDNESIINNPLVKEKYLGDSFN